MQSVLEIATLVCRSAADVERQVRTLRGYVAETAAQRGLTVGGVLSSPKLLGGDG
jgi:gamma-glutamyl:cysteine ligase YbdK (ATP-grasp superfamily)